MKKEIADRFNISVTTVATLVGHIYEKFEVQNAPAAITKTFKLRILPAQEQPFPCGHTAQSTVLCGTVPGPFTALTRSS